MLAISSGLLAGICAAAAVGLLGVIIVGTRRVRREPPLDPEVETRLLLGQPPEQIDEALDEEARDGQQATISDLPLDDRV